MSEKVYGNEIVEENPYPNGEVQSTSQTGSSSGDTYSPTVTKENPLPKKRIASELIGQALNTRSKKILQEFELVQSGGFKIGNFKEGVSGEVAITPSGIVTKDKAGLTTIAMYGEDGSGLFKGTLQAGTLIAGDSSVVIDEIDGHGRMLFYEGNTVAILLGWGDF